MNFAKVIFQTFIIIILIVSKLSAQQLIQEDSLDSVLSLTKNPDKKVDLILEFLDEPENQYLDYKIAINIATRALNIAQKEKYHRGEVNAMIRLGNYCLKNGEYKKTMEFAQNAKDMAEDMDFSIELAQALSLIGNTYSELGEYENSSKYLFNSLKLSETLNEEEVIARVLGDIGLDFYGQQYYKKALEYFNQSLIRADKLKDQHLIKKQYNNIAAVYAIFNKYDTAIIIYKKALLINLKLGDELAQGINIMNLGYVKMNNGKFNDALMYFKRSLPLLIKYNNQEHMAECNINIAYCLYNLNSIDSSIYFFKNAISIGLTKKYYTVISDASKTLSQIYTDRQDFQKAIYYLNIGYNSLDSLNYLQKNDYITKHEIQYIYDKREFERNIAQKEHDKVMLIIIFSLISGLIIIFLLFSRFRVKSRLLVIEKKKINLEKDKAESELIMKNKELTINLLSLIKKNELLSDLSAKLAQLESNSTIKDIRNNIARISRELRINTDDKMINEFTLRFQEVHAGFYEKLLSTYPDLTPNDLKLCAFLRLNMSTKDIAELTGQQIAAINKGRYRLRKKLNLSGTEDNLVSFLSQIMS